MSENKNPSTTSLVLFSLESTGEIRAAVAPGEGLGSAEDVFKLLAQVAPFAHDCAHGMKEKGFITCSFEALAVVTRDVAIRNRDASTKHADAPFLDGMELHFDHDEVVNPQFADTVLKTIYQQQERLSSACEVRNADLVLVLAISASDVNLLDGVRQSAVVFIPRVQVPDLSPQGAELLAAYDQLQTAKYTPLIISINDGKGPERNLILGLKPKQGSVPPKE